jgi:hypothetical protein
MDVDANMSADRAAEKEAEKICSDILSSGKYRTPDPAMDLSACLRIGSQFRAIGETKRVPEKHMDLMYKWLDDVAAAMPKTPTPPAAPAPGGPPAPGAPAPGAPAPAMPA